MSTMKSLTKSTPRKRYGVTEKKKAELDNLTLQVLEAQQEVDQYKSIVAALTTKYANFQAMLADADTQRTNALNNVNTLQQVSQNFSDLQTNSTIAFNASVEANLKTGHTAHRITEVVNKLIYSAELINKLAAYVARKKALNPLVSDQLVSTLNQAGTDANNAVALAMVAMQSVYAAQASTIESEAAFALESLQASGAYQFMNGLDAQGNPLPDPNNTQKYIDCLVKSVKECYDYWKKRYNTLYDANNQVQQQLNQSQINLAQASLYLQSLQAGLAAGNAAALAS